MYGSASSCIVIADCTLQRPNVYFEAGFAMGLGRRLIWSCRASDIKDLHFDTRQYNFLAWENPSHLRRILADRLAARGD